MKLLPFFFAAVVAVCAGAVQAQDAEASDAQLYDDLRETTIAPLFDSLKAGDLTGIKRHLRSDLYEQYRVLFEQNTEYGQYLRDYYAGSSYELVDVRRKKGALVAEVAVVWPGGRTVKIDLQVDDDGEQRTVTMDESGG